MDFAKLIERAKSICLSPKTEWEKIAAETADVLPTRIRPTRASAALLEFVPGLLPPVSVTEHV